MIAVCAVKSQKFLLQNESTSKIKEKIASYAGVGEKQEYNSLFSYCSKKTFILLKLY